MPHFLPPHPRPHPHGGGGIRQIAGVFEHATSKHPVHSGPHTPPGRDRVTGKAISVITMGLIFSGTQTHAHTTEHHDLVPQIKIEFATFSGDRLVLGKQGGKIRALNAVPVARVAAVGVTRIPNTSNLALMQSAFGKFPKLRTRSDGRYFYVESDAIPDHNMMVGIKAWQQQVPVPQPFTGDNSWQIPLNPVPARNPMSTRNNFLLGAIAFAVNGVPIFNALNNRGVDCYAAGELDHWGGHCGRGDDYHYHVAPVHLQKIVGADKPVAWALDGYPIYGYTESNGAAPRNLDSFKGHDHGTGYHYHATKSYPYLNGGFHGEVQHDGSQVIPQPRGAPIRPATSPLRGATITGFSGNLQDGYSLKYEVYGRPAYINYKTADNGTATFNYVDTAGRTTTQTYTRRQGRQGGGGERRPRPQDNRRPNDREMSEDELAEFFLGGRGGGGAQRPPQRGGKPGGDQRKPWIANHFDELDTNGDGKVSRAEMAAEGSKAFAAYDRNRDGRISSDEYGGRGGARTALGGFVRQHAAELDENQDRYISSTELQSFVLRMFSKADRDRDNIVTKEEANSPGGGRRGGGKGGRPQVGPRPRKGPR